MESSKMCKMWVWTAPAWSDCMYTLPKNTPEMELNIMVFLIIFKTFTQEGQSCCQGMSMGCQGGALGYQKDAKESNFANNAGPGGKT